MGNDNDFRKLVEIIFMKKPATRKELLSPESSIPACLQVNDFYPKLRYVLFIRRLIICSRWESLLEKYYICEMLDSHEMYGVCVIKVFFEEHACNLNVFDSFLSVCCLVYFISEEILQCTGLDFSNLNADLVMEFYDSTLKMFFSKRGGIQGFVEYIRDHKYLAWKWDRHNLNEGGPYSQVNQDTISQLQKEFKKELDYHKSINLNKDAFNDASLSMGLKVIKTTSVKLPTLPSNSDLTNRVTQFRESETKEKSERKRTLNAAAEIEVLENLWKEFMSPDLGSTVSQNVKEIDKFARYKKIIQAVISYNNSRNSDIVHLDNPILKEADETIEHLKDTIVSLIDVLDHYDEK